MNQSINTQSVSQSASQSVNQSVKKYHCHAFRSFASFCKFLLTFVHDTRSTLRGRLIKGTNALVFMLFHMYADGSTQTDRVTASTALSSPTPLHRNGLFYSAPGLQTRRFVFRLRSLYMYRDHRLNCRPSIRRHEGMLSRLSVHPHQQFVEATNPSNRQHVTCCPYVRQLYRYILVAGPFDLWPGTEHAWFLSTCCQNGKSRSTSHAFNMLPRLNLLVWTGLNAQTSSFRFVVDLQLVARAQR